MPLIAERNTAAAERDTAQQELAAAKGQLSDLQAERDGLQAQVDAAAKAGKDAVLAELDRPVLSLATSPSQRGRHRVQLKDDADKVVLHSPAGYGSQDKADEVIERICGSRLEKAE